eukprot:CAMPEP_0117531458 /NCGR_PEP_ID=MMETSP0784-20121206/38868_1 /TAXON_ID=39447 /ORGANISM="" /LENGTH=535 /DNA_ID=CAMNT_0005327831 /DNA_START=138 /DNA_END=1745 /DNA_ORIENTATION=-
MKSPTWVAPISQFIDERCDIFEGEEENSHEQSTCHDHFKLLVNDLFAAHLLEVSITPEMFESFCVNGLGEHKQLHHVLVEQLLCVDDFLTFKAMMTKHNADLAREIVSADITQDEHAFVADQVVASSISHGLGEDWQLYEESTHARSEQTAETVDAQERCDEAALQQVIALSIQIEEERLRLIAEEDADIERTIAYSATPAPPPLPPNVGFISAPLCAAPARPRIQEVPHMVQVDAMPRLQARPWGFTSAPLQYAPPVLPTEPPPEVTHPVAAAAAAPPPSICRGPRFFTSSPLCILPPKPKVPAAPAADPAPLAYQPEVVAPPPVEAVPYEAAPQPQLHLQPEPQPQPRPQPIAVEGMRSNLMVWRQRAERAINEPMKEPASSLPTRGARKQALAQAAMAPSSGPTEEERRQRAEHLARQRDRLMQKRAKEREQQLVNFPASRGRAPPPSAFDQVSGGPSAAHAAAGRRLVAELTQGAVVAAPTAPQFQDPAAAADRMRQAITNQLKSTLMRSMPSDASDLDAQLRYLESRRLG